ncbi:MAG: hypothetical protein D6784_16830, partial [Chloroflexi bacterium]
EEGWLYVDEDEAEDFPEEARPRGSVRRTLAGCLTLLVVVGLVFGAIGALGAYQGLKERSARVQAEALTHYQKGQEHLANDSLDLAIAEFEMALSLNPNLLEARQALRQAQEAAQARPTPTSETRTAAAVSLLQAAEAQVEQQNWPEAVKTLSDLRSLDPDFEPERVSDLLFTANYNLALSLLAPDSLEEAVGYLEAALSAQPDNADAAAELDRALLYLRARQAQVDNPRAAVRLFGQLYSTYPEYLDVPTRLAQSYAALGDALIDAGQWCEAETQFAEAIRIQPSDALKSKADLSARRCEALAQTESAPSPAATRPPSAVPGTPDSATPTGPATEEPVAGGGSGRIFFSAYNRNESRWEILAVPATGGTPQLVVANGTMPAVSPDGRLLLYRSESPDSEGLHIFDLTAGEDQRITIFRQDMLPRWGGSTQDFLFTAQEPATGRWKIQRGFADGKGEPEILRDGRTPDRSPDGRQIAYQGTDPGGNNPGLYLVPFGGGDPVRLTNHESDRSPAFSPDGAQLAYMSTRSGNWDVFVVSTAGSQPRQITTAPGNDGLPVWSPDGTRLAFVSDEGGSWAIYTISAEGGEPVRVTAWDGINRESWLLAQIWWGP